MRLFIILLLALPLSSFAADDSQLRPVGITIENAFYVGQSKDLVRGRSPKDNIPELRPAGITNILIIKNQTRGEVTIEIADLKAHGFKDEEILAVPYKWKDIDQVVACKQTAEILKHIAEVEATEGAKLYFHCTAGVDRTGLIAGLYRLTSEPGSTLRGIFRTEMCDRGYGDADSRPPKVLETIHTELTPIYLKFARAIIRDRRDHFLKQDLSNICKPAYYNSLAVENFVKEELPRTKCRP